MNPELEAVWLPAGASNPERVTCPAQYAELVHKFVCPRTGELNRFLFRGVPSESHELVPSLARLKGDRPWITQEMLYHIERESTEQFKTKAHLYLEQRFLPPDPKAKDVSLRWWQIMQHHGAKTRILDWTASPFVAAYFAAACDPSDNGVVWMIDYGAHFDRMKELHLDRMCRGEWEFEVCTKPHHGPDLSTSLFFSPVSSPNERMSAQRGWFSCASEVDTDHGEAIASAFLRCKTPPGRWTRKVIIAREAKSSFLRDLWMHNITGETLFPGLDGLGRAMSEVPKLLEPDDQVNYQFENGLLSMQAQTAPSNADTPPGGPKG